MLASLQSWGQVLDEYEFEKMKVRIGEICLAVSFRIRAGRRSGPVALEMFRFRSNFWMPLGLNVRSSIGGTVQDESKGMLLRSS